MEYPEVNKVIDCNEDRKLFASCLIRALALKDFNAFCSSIAAQNKLANLNFGSNHNTYKAYIPSRIKAYERMSFDYVYNRLTKSFPLDYPDNFKDELISCCTFEWNVNGYIIIEVDKAMPSVGNYMKEFTALAGLNLDYFTEERYHLYSEKYL